MVIKKIALSFLLIITVLLFSCKENKKQLTQEENINQITAPLIANEVGDLNILVQTAKNINLTQRERGIAINQLRNKFSEYMADATSISFYLPQQRKLSNEEIIKKVNKEIEDSSIGQREVRQLLDSIFSKRFDERVNFQKKFIEVKYKQYGAQILYKKHLEDSIKKSN